MNMLGVGFVHIGDFIPEDNTPPFDDVLTAIGLMLDHGLTPAGADNSEKAKEIIKGLLAGIRQQTGNTDE